jgi:hypothetical protein
VHVSRRLPVNPLPPINLDAFKICSFNQWRPGEFGFVIIAVSFGTPSYSPKLLIRCQPWAAYVGVSFCRSFRVHRDLLCGQRTKAEGIPRYSKSLEENPARCDEILLPHGRLPDSASLLSLSRSGTLISGGPGVATYISVVAHRTCVCFSHRFSSCQGCEFCLSSSTFKRTLERSIIKQNARHLPPDDGVSPHALFETIRHRIDWTVVSFVPVPSDIDGYEPRIQVTRDRCTVSLSLERRGCRARRVCAGITLER